MRRDGPEKIVEGLVLAWARANGFDLSVVDTSARFSRAAGVYKRNMSASESLTDLVGNYAGLSVWIELKAPGCRGSVNSAKQVHQRAFLVRKIEQGCFACVTDSVEHLSELWTKYKSAAHRKQVLIDDLPVPSSRRRIAEGEPR